MDDRPLPLDIARFLVHRFGESALDVARNRAASAARSGEMKEHDHALMVLTEIEELLLDCCAGHRHGERSADNVRPGFQA